MNYTEFPAIQQTTADHLEHQLDWKLVFAYHNEDFEPGKVWHWYERWNDEVRKHCRDSGGKYP